MRSDMNLEETDDVAAETQDVLAHHLERFGKLDLSARRTPETPQDRIQMAPP
jgi:hypothetical protein